MNDKLASDRLEQLFQRALEQPDSSRDEWLARECKDDLGLLKQIRELLGYASKNEDGLLDAPITGFFEQIPTQIGSYKVSRLLGAGGIGAVFDAIHLGTHRRAAIKLIRTGFNTTRQRIRFQIEAESLAKLNHPGIAQLYDAGVADVHYADSNVSARLFIAMEFIDGVPIVEHARSRSLTIRQKVELIRDVAHAVAHAHQRGVIHRDLKPANLLVDAEGHPKIVDFGISRLVESTHAVTVEGAAIGTPSYMSPEQLSGDASQIDLPTDVYGLGAVLYTLISGQPPIESTGLLTPALALKLLAQEPRPLTSFVTIDRDLAAVIHKALERNPRHRYENASEFASDLERWLSGRPTIARPVGVLRRMSKAAMRRPRATAAAILALYIVITLASIAVWQAIEARSALAKERYALSEQRAAVDYINNLLLRASPDSRESLGPDYKLVDLIDQANREIKILTDRPLVQADVRLTLGKIYLAMGKLDDAEMNLKSALEAKQQLGASSADIIDVKELLARLFQDQNHWSEARVLRKEVADWRLEHLGPDSVQTLLAQAEQYVADIVLHIPISTGEFDLMVHRLEAIKSKRGDSWTVDDDLALLRMREIAVYLFIQLVDQQVRGEPLLKAAEAQAMQLLGADHPTTIRLQRSRGIALVRSGNYVGAIPLLDSVRDRLAKELGDEHPNVLSLDAIIASSLAYDGQFDRALALSAKAESGLGSVYGPTNLRTIQARQSRAHCLALQGKFEDSESLLMKCLDEYKMAGGPNQYFITSSWMQLADLRRRQDRHAEAVEIYKSRLPVVVHEENETTGEIAEWYSEYADSLMKIGEKEQARNVLDRAVRSLHKSFGPDAVHTRKAQERLDALSR